MEQITLATAMGRGVSHPVSMYNTCSCISFDHFMIYFLGDEIDVKYVSGMDNTPFLAHSSTYPIKNGFTGFRLIPA